MRNVLYGPNLDRAVAGGFTAQDVAAPGGAFSRVVTGFNENGPTAIQPALDSFARPDAVDPASLANLYGTYVARMTSRLDTFDLKLGGAPWRLPAGPLRLAVGGEFRRDALTGTPDENARLSGPTGRRWLGAPFFDPFARPREVRAGFAEVRVPLAGEKRSFPGTRELDVNAAYRFEHYSDAGHKGMPPVGVRWRPADAPLALRTRYGEAFTTPPLYSRFGPRGRTGPARLYNCAPTPPRPYDRGGATKRHHDHLAVAAISFEYGLSMPSLLTAVTT